VARERRAEQSGGELRLEMADAARLGEQILPELLRGVERLLGGGAGRQQSRRAGRARGRRNAQTPHRASSRLRCLLPRCYAARAARERWLPHGCAASARWPCPSV